MKKYKRVLSISAGLSIFTLLLVSNLLGILTDKEVRDLPYDMPAGTVAIELDVTRGDNDGSSIQIQPNQTTPLEITVTNVGTKECYVFVELVIPKVGDHEILSITPNGGWEKIDVAGRNVYQYVMNGSGRALEPQNDTGDLVDVARFYDFTEMTGFEGSMQVIAYAVQTDGFDGAEASEVWSATVSATASTGE